MSHITIIIGSGLQEAATSKSSVEESVTYIPGHDVTWEQIGKEVKKIEKKMISGTGK